MLVWHAWKEHNRWILCEKYLPTKEIIWKIKNGICEVANSNCSLKSETQFTNWDNVIQKRSDKLKSPMKNITSKSKVRSDAKWLPSRKGRFKLSFDGVAKGNSSLASVGCIIRNERGKFVWELSRKLGVATNNEAEMEDLICGLWLCLEKGIRDVDIEGDSHICINTIRKQSTHNWKLKPWIKKIWQCLDRLGVFLITHVYRESNKDVDQLENKGVLQDYLEGIYDSLNLFSNLEETILKEKPVF